VNSEDELRAISTIFSGLYDLNRNAKGTDQATLAAQGFEKYFADLPRISLTRELEIGLFGELSTISVSSKKVELVRGWHSAPDATYDFSFGGNRLEVKTSTRPTRLVWLRSSQTTRYTDPNLTYLSIYAPPDDAGMNVRELAEQIRASLDPSLRTTFDEKLAFYDVDSCTFRFDIQETKASLRFIKSAEVPVASIQDPRVIEVRWKCSFCDLPNESESSVWI
ncbi:MAG: PD-(D/E)XK motif protein, partial [Methylophilaceae bacterium]